MNLGKDPAELQKIEEARKAYGEFQFKMDADYEVPEHETVDSKKKRQQMILLEGSIHKLKLDFNKRISELRMRKQENISLIERKYARLTEINAKLGTPEELILPTIDEENEYPEKFFNVTDDQIADYKVELKQREEQKKSKNQNQGNKKRKAEQAQKEKEAANKKAAEEEKKKSEAKHEEAEKE